MLGIDVLKLILLRQVINRSILDGRRSEHYHGSDDCGRLVWVTGTWFLHLLLIIKNHGLWTSFSPVKTLCLKIPQVNRFNICEKKNVP